MVSYTGNILGIQNQIIPFGALSIRWNKLQSLLVTTVMNDSFQFTTCQSDRYTSFYVLKKVKIIELTILPGGISVMVALVVNVYLDIGIR